MNINKNNELLLSIQKLDINLSIQTCNVIISEIVEGHKRGMDDGGDVDCIIFMWALEFLQEVSSVCISSLKVASDVVNSSLFSWQKIDLIFQLACTDYSFDLHNLEPMIDLKEGDLRCHCWQLRAKSLSPLISTTSIESLWKSFSTGLDILENLELSKNNDGLNDRNKSKNSSNYHNGNQQHVDGTVLLPLLRQLLSTIVDIIQHNTGQALVDFMNGIGHENKLEGKDIKLSCRNNALKLLDKTIQEIIFKLFPSINSYTKLIEDQNSIYNYGSINGNICDINRMNNHYSTMKRIEYGYKDEIIDIRNLKKDINEYLGRIVGSDEDLGQWSHLSVRN
jgi:hypothetical protein